MKLEVTRKPRQMVKRVRQRRDRESGKTVLINPHLEELEESIEFISERTKGERRKPCEESSILPNVSHIVSTSNGQTVVSVTCEDKAVNVFDVQSEGTLELKSRRYARNPSIRARSLMIA